MEKSAVHEHVGYQLPRIKREYTASDWVKGEEPQELNRKGNLTHSEHGKDKKLYQKYCYIRDEQILYNRRKKSKPPEH